MSEMSNRRQGVMKTITDATSREGKNQAVIAGTGIVMIETGTWIEIEQETGRGDMMTVKEMTEEDVIPLQLMVSTFFYISPLVLILFQISHERGGLDGETSLPKSKSPVCPSL
jgi:hypothetical protein